MPLPATGRKELWDVLGGLLLLMACQLAGEVLARVLGLPLPGPVIGIPLLFVILLLRDRFARSRAEPKGLAQAADGLISFFGLLFVPAGVGIIQTYGVFLANSFPVLASLVLSTLITLTVTVLVFRFGMRLKGGQRQP